MDAIDKKIINRIQSDFPIEKRPYEIIGKSLGISEAETIKRIRVLKEKLIIRRIGGNINPYSIGFVSTLCAAKVSEDKKDKFIEVVNGYKGVTHNYEREDNFNVWFTFIANTREEIEENLKTIKFKTGVKEILNLPAEKIFKISAKFFV